MKNIIVKVLKNSIAEELELEPGDELISVNNCSVKDYIDYKYQISDENVTLEVKKSYGEIWELEIEKEYDEDIGIVFENTLMDNIKVCSNKCIFCFIDQLPRGMRETLYLKDEDTRLSFLYGNFITLTNLSDDEIERIVKYKISPIKVSVHTTDRELRKYMMGNKKDMDILEYLKRLLDAGITVDCQIVLVRDVNDGAQLEKTIRDLSGLHPGLRSVAVVPVGLTKFRGGLAKLKPFDRESAAGVVNQVTALQDELFEKLGTRFIFIADEFYISGEMDFPPYESYEDFDQLENGIGMCRLFRQQIEDLLNDYEGVKPVSEEVTFVTGAAAYDLMVELSEKIMKKISVKINVVKIVNNFFGERITVSGLTTGHDIIEQLKDKNYKNIILPRNMINDNNVTLDDLTVDDLKKELNTEVEVCDVDGKALLNLITK
ncbi:MAG TPA: radical SAM protein [Clostridiales bacterium]|nr:radical SAM protein [Clostridiales bacterium]